MDYKKILVEMLEKQKYICLATSNTEAEPWASPVSYVYDGSKTLYFISAIDSLHSRNIAENPKISFSLYDSHQILKNAFGVQARGTANCIDDWHISPILKQKLFERVSLAILSKEHSFFRITIDEIYLPNAERWKELEDVKRRIEL